MRGREVVEEREDSSREARVECGAEAGRAGYGREERVESGAVEERVGCGRTERVKAARWKNARTAAARCVRATW